MIIEYIFEHLTHVEKLAISKFLHRFLDVLDMRYLQKRSYYDE